jgi:hypothetical protein
MARPDNRRVAGIRFGRVELLTEAGQAAIAATMAASVAYSRTREG